MPDDRPSPPEPMVPRRILIGGLVGLLVGTLCLGISLFFLLAPWDKPEEVCGVFVPLAMAVPGLAFGTAALIPLAVTMSGARRLVPVVWLSIATGALVMIFAGTVQGTLPWIGFAVLP